MEKSQPPMVSCPETCRLLQKAYPAMKIILLSVDTEDRQTAQEAGAAFIHKDASPDDVLAVREPLLETKKNQRKAFWRSYILWPCWASWVMTGRKRNVYLGETDYLE